MERNTSALLFLHEPCLPIDVIFLPASTQSLPNDSSMEVYLRDGELFLSHFACSSKSAGGGSNWVSGDKGRGCRNVGLLEDACRRLKSPRNEAGHSASYTIAPSRTSRNRCPTPT